MRTARAMVSRVLLALVVPALMTTCTDDDGSTTADADLGNRFEATTDHLYSFRFPSEWTLGEEAEGELVIGIQDSVGMVLEPVHPWGGEGAFGAPDAERVEIDGYDAYRLVLEGDPAAGKGLAYRIHAAGVDATVWFFARQRHAYDVGLFDGIMHTFRFEEDLLEA